MHTKNPRLLQWDSTLTLAQCVEDPTCDTAHNRRSGAGAPYPFSKPALTIPPPSMMRGASAAASPAAASLGAAGAVGATATGAGRLNDSSCERLSTSICERCSASKSARFGWCRPGTCSRRAGGAASKLHHGSCLFLRQSLQALQREYNGKAPQATFVISRRRRRHLCAAPQASRVRSASDDARARRRRLRSCAPPQANSCAAPQAILMRLQRRRQRSFVRGAAGNAAQQVGACAAPEVTLCF